MRTMPNHFWSDGFAVPVMFGGTSTNRKVDASRERDRWQRDVRRWQDYTGKKATLEGDGRTFDAVAEKRLGQNAERPAAADAGRADQEAGEC